MSNKIFCLKTKEQQLSQEKECAVELQPTDGDPFYRPLRVEACSERPLFNLLTNEQAHM